MSCVSTCDADGARRRGHADLSLERGEHAHARARRGSPSRCRLRGRGARRATCERSAQQRILGRLGVEEAHARQDVGRRVAGQARRDAVLEDAAERDGDRDADVVALGGHHRHATGQTGAVGVQIEGRAREAERQTVRVHTRKQRGIRVRRVGAVREAAPVPPMARRAGPPPVDVLRRRCGDGRPRERNDGGGDSPGTRISSARG